MKFYRIMITVFLLNTLILHSQNDVDFDNHSSLEIKKMEFMNRFLSSENRKGEFKIKQHKYSEYYKFPFLDFDEFASYCGEKINKITLINLRLEKSISLSGIEKFVNLKDFRLFNSELEEIITIQNAEQLHHCLKLSSLLIDHNYEMDGLNISQLNKLSLLILSRLKNPAYITNLPKSLFILQLTYEVDYISEEKAKHLFKVHAEKIAPRYFDVFAQPVKNGMSVYPDLELPH